MWYFSDVPEVEDEVTARVSLQECAGGLDDVTKKVLEGLYGDGLEGMPAAFGYETDQAEEFLRRLAELGAPRKRMVILHRFGMITGIPAGLRETAVLYGVSENYVRHTENGFLKLKERLRVIKG